MGSENHDETIGLGQVVLITTVVLATIAVAVLAYFLVDVLLLFFIGVVLSAALQPTHAKLCQLGLPRTAAVLVIYALLAAAVVAVCLLLGPAIVAQLTTFIDEIPKSYGQFLNALRSSSAAPVRTIGWRLPSFDALLRSASDVSPEFYESALGVTSSVIAVFTFFITVVVVALYWTLEVPRLERLFVSLLPVARRPRALVIWHEIEFKLGAYIRAQGIAMVVIGVASAIGYALIGLPNVLLLAAIAGLLEAVPLIGPVLGAIPAIAVAMPMGIETILMVVGMTMLVQAFENNILIPRLMSEATGVSALVSIFAVLAFGTLYGVLGVFIAVPIAAVAQVLLDRMLLDREPVADVPPVAGTEPLATLRGRVRAMQQRVRARLRARDSRMGIDPDSSDHVIDAVDQQIETAVERMARLIATAEESPRPLSAHGRAALVEALEYATEHVETAMQRVEGLLAQMENGSPETTADLPIGELTAATQQAERAVERAQTIVAESAGEANRRPTFTTNTSRHQGDPI